MASKEITPQDAIQESPSNTIRAISPVTEVPKGPWKPTTRIYIVITSLMVIILAAALDATALSVALPIMAQKLGGTAIEAFWAGTSFLLTSTVFQPVFASLSDHFGRKMMILASLALFTIGSIVAAVANDFGVIIVGRSIQGVGGGGIIVFTEIILTDIVPLRERGKYFGFIGMMWALGTVSGPLLGGAFAQSATWRWIFWMNLPFAAVGFVMIPIFLKLNTRAGSVLEKLKKVDWIGSIMFIGSTTSMLIPLTWGGVMYDWDHWRTLTPLLIGAVGTIATVIYEGWFAKHPAIRLSIFNSRTAVVNYFGTVMHGIILWGILYFLPLYYEGVKGMTAIMAGVALLPQTLTVAPASIAGGIIASITGNFRYTLWVGWALTVEGCGLMYLLEPGTSTVKWIFLNLVGGIGTGLLFPSTAFAIQAAVSNKDTAYAVAFYGFMRVYGQCLGIAIGGVVFQNALRSQLAKAPQLAELAGEYVKDAVALAQAIKHMPDAAPEKLALRIAYAEALQVVWLAMIGFAAAGLITSLFTENLTLDRELETEHGFKDEKKIVDEDKV